MTNNSGIEILREEQAEKFLPVPPFVPFKVIVSHSSLPREAALDGSPSRHINVCVLASCFFTEGQPIFRPDSILKESPAVRTLFLWVSNGRVSGPGVSLLGI